MKARHSIKQQPPAPLKAMQRGTAISIRPITPAAKLKNAPERAIGLPPLPACDGVDVWITAAQARKILGVGLSAIYRLVDPDRPFLVVKRPLPRKILISLRSVKAFAEATKNPLFWQCGDLQQQLLAKVRQMTVESLAA